MHHDASNLISLDMILLRFFFLLVKWGQRLLFDLAVIFINKDVGNFMAIYVGSDLFIYLE